ELLGRHRAWRPARDPALQCAALVFLAEYRSHWAVERRLGPAFPTTDLTLHDFALWIHRPARWDDFWLVTTRSDVASRAASFRSARSPRAKASGSRRRPGSSRRSRSGPDPSAQKVDPLA